MRVHKPVEAVRGRVELLTSPIVRRVELERGRAGYGFTIAGQAPCLLSGIMKGSPSCTVGLSPGDYILGVNGRDVSEASYETVVELIGSSSQSLCLLVMSGDRQALDSSSSDEELTFQRKQKATWLNPGKMESNISQRYEKDMLLMQSVGSFDTIFEISGQASTSTQSNKQRPLSEPDMSYWAHQGHYKCHTHLFGQEEPSHVVSKDSVFSELQSQYDILPDSSTLNVGMVVGYISSVDLDLVMSHSEEDTLRAIRGCISQIGIEQKTHSLVMMRIKCNCVQLCDNKGMVLAAYPAENLALCVVCTEDNRFFCLVSMEQTKADKIKSEESNCLRTLCHVFFVDPELCDHKEHKSITDQFGFLCTPDPDTQGCLEFPRTPFSILHFVSVLYTDLGDYIEKLRLKLDSEDSDEGQSCTRNSGSGDSGIGNVSPEDHENLGDQWSLKSPNSSYHLWGKTSLCISQQKNRMTLKPERRCLLSEPFPGPTITAIPQAADRIRPEVAGCEPLHPLPLVKQSDLSDNTSKRSGNQRWPSVGIRTRWQKPRPNSIESLADGDTNVPKVKSRTLPPAMNQIPTMRYRKAGDLTYQQRPHLDFTWKLFNSGSKNKDGENKGSGFWDLTRVRSSVRTRTKRLSLARSLDDLEAVASDGGGMKRTDCGSFNSLQSNGSLSCLTNHQCPPDRRVASWSISFERLLQDPMGVRYFSEFLKKEFSEENIMFWQACEFFSQVPEHDKKQLSQKAREIYNNFLSSKATTPVNIDSQAQLADDVLTAPRPDMFKQPQLQIFNLMKFDSYARFLKSSLYQECMLAEVEGRPLPDPYQVPCSPAPSRHSYNSDRSTFTTPKKETRKPRTGKSSEDLRDDHDRKAGLFSWYRNRSFGKGPRKREITDLNYDGNGRRESQGSLSSGASQELNVPCSTVRNESSERVNRSCTVALPDGSTCCLPLRHSASIRQVLLELCQQQHINLAAVDLFLTGGEKPLVLDQDSMTLSCRDVRLEKRTLFRLDLVPINRSVGLKAKPTKPVAEVLRPVVAKYDLRLSDLVARISGETEALDLGLPISNLDGLRVVLERADPSSSKEKSKTISPKGRGPLPVSKGQSTLEARKSPGKSVKGDGRVKHPIPEPSHPNKIRLEEAEEFFELLSRAQSSRADDQRGLLRKEDLVLPDFLRLDPVSAAPPICSTPTSQKLGHSATHPQPITSNGQPHGPHSKTASFVSPLSPILPPVGLKGEDGEGMCDLTLVGEGDISSPNSTLLPPVPSSPSHEGSLPETAFTPAAPCAHSQRSSGAKDGGDVCTPTSHHQGVACSCSPPQEGSVPLDKKLGVDGVTLEDSFEGYAAELRQCQSKMRNGAHPSFNPTRPLSTLADVNKNNTVQYKATFV
ncbi:regulator of G-protein signaling 12 isoform X1 [Electrophorus electricus]|uniref:regulator of G-protein signaling 12 isoform X1 n=1 Tax=Electrophorus electricus TaxID=8005 RepID=UPI0015CFD52D|nr:regulator of G-protein signaling 12 isoform X1 [Electrophorus electricus]XP_026873044.2 regulator of G-protein signaling 12 isoform X1 [Electrophorus electricus]XP_026873045.2 regulator of G-protein signaling 12 isoform X1 [Electrophorus electricus]